MNTPGSAGKQQMSDSLKARLKKCGRSYCSPVISRSTPGGASSQNTSPQINNSGKSALKRSSGVSSSFKSPLSQGASSSFRSPVVNPACSSSKSPATNSQKRNLTFQTPTNIGKVCVVNTSDSSSEAPTRRTLAEEFDEAQKNIKNPLKRNSENDEKLPESEHDEPLICHKRRKISGRLISNSESECFNPDLVKTDAKTLPELNKMKAHLLKIKAEKEERLRKLNMVKLQQSKNNVSELRSLTSKWRSITQMALQRLLELTREPRPTLTRLVDHLQLDHSMIGYSAEDESFT